MKKRIHLFGTIIILASLFFCSNASAQEIELYPKKYQTLPNINSPTELKNGIEVIIRINAAGDFSVLPVTQEKGEIYSCLYGFNGKGDQMWIAEPDFHSLGRTGLHSEEELNSKTMITGRPIGVINFISKPNRFSISGFLADDEDIISVLKGDNRIVGKLGLVHRQLAKPLFHVWNAILGNYFGVKETATILYNSNKVFITSTCGKGYQESIFHDEIEGKYWLYIWRELDQDEFKFLKTKYANLSDEDFKSLIEKLTHLHIGEMLPFYIMRYGFYEGHTAFRAEPLAIAIIFGLKSIYEIDSLFNSDLYEVVNRHFTSTTLLSD